MKKRKITGLLLVTIIFAFLLAACGGPNETSSGKNSSRIEELIEAWNAAGINALIKEKTSSNTLNAMYGCINQYTVLLDDEQFMILEYDLKNLNSTAESYLQFVDKNGCDTKTDEPAWHNGEFLLQNSFLVIENGEVLTEYFIQDHPKSTLILETFKAFE